MTTMRTEIDSEHGIVYLASTFAYRAAHLVEVGDVVAVDLNGVADFDRVYAIEASTYRGAGYVKLWFEGSRDTKTYAPDDRVMLAV